MPGVTYALVDFVTGGPILDLPIMEGAAWATQLNRGDSLSCTVDMRDADALALDMRSASEPRKTILLARTDDDEMIAWGIIDDDREWDETKQTLTLTAKGVEPSWLAKKLVGPAAARTSPLVVNGLPNVALDTNLSGYSLGTIGKKLVQQALTWPGAPTWFVLPADQSGTHQESYPFPNLTRVGKALSDLTDRVNGPDFAFDISRAANGLNLICTMRHGSEGVPRIGSKIGSWSLGGAESPISDFKVKDNSSDFATASWGTGGKQADTVMMSRALNDALIMSGYPPLDYVDKSHNDVTEQTTLDSYTVANALYVVKPMRSVSFKVQADAAPRLGLYRPGDTMTIDVDSSHPYLTGNIEIRITSMSGDETGKTVTIGSEVIG